MATSPPAEMGPDDALAIPAEVAPFLRTTEPALAQMRYRGTGPKFVKVGGGHRGRVLYRWSDVRAYLDAQTRERTDDSRGVGAA